MIAGCGIDLVRVARLDKWHSFADRQLRHVFTQAEIAAIRHHTRWSAQRAAGYFALKEAFYKALSTALIGTGKLKKKIYFGQVCPLVTVHKNTWGVPELLVDWQGIVALVEFHCQWQVHCSYAHESEYATAYVILSTISSDTNHLS